MKKHEAILIVNNYLGKTILNKGNTNFSKINDEKEVWWLNIPPDRFSNDLHLLLLTQKGFNWIKIPANSFSNLGKIFRIRSDRNVVDLEISADNRNFYMRDIKSGGTGFNFEPFIAQVFTI